MIRRKFSGCVANNVNGPLNKFMTALIDDMQNMVINQASVSIEDPKGLRKVYNDSNTGSGGTAKRSFCSNCGRSGRI
jgi:hypothetical protein